MPIYESQASPPTGLTTKGGIFPVNIQLPQVLVDHLTSKNTPIPPPISGSALIDTGASVSVVDLSVLRKLKINPIGVATVTTTAGHTQQNLFPARFQLARLLIDINAVLGANLSSQGLTAIIGRDILSKCILIYHGPAGRITLVH